MNDLLVKFVEENADEIKMKFDFLRNSSNQIFKLPQGEEGNDLFGMIIEEIKFHLNFICILFSILQANAF